MSIFNTGANWEATRVSDLEKSRRNAWLFTLVFAVCLVVAIIALALLTPLRRTVPYVVLQDSQTGNVEVLQPFDNRAIGNQELLNKYWARKYVLAREQYNWWLVGADFDAVAALSDPPIFAEYDAQFKGDQALDKVFADHTDRKVNILSVTPSPTNPFQMVVRFERTTVTRGQVVEAPTIFVSNLVFRYAPNPYGAETELLRNPMGFQVYSYRRDVERPGAAPVGSVAPAIGTSVAPAPVGG